jgi:hypothetical protein
VPCGGGGGIAAVEQKGRSTHKHKNQIILDSQLLSFQFFFFSSFHLSFPPPPFFLNIHKTTGSLTDANDRKFPRKTKKHKNKKKIGKMPREEEKEDP